MKIRTYQTPQPAPPAAAPLAELTPPAYFARVATAAAICAAAALAALALLALRLAPDKTNPLDLALTVIALSLLIGGVSGAYWTFRMVNRPIKDLESEIDTLRAEIAYLENLKTPPPPDPVAPANLKALNAAYTLVFRSLMGQDTARSKSGLDQTDHNNAVRLLREVDIVTGDRKAIKYQTDPARIYPALLKLSADPNVPDLIYIAEAPNQIRPVRLEK